MNRFDQFVRQARGDSLRSGAAVIIQANLGLRCNLHCRHCHVEASPQRSEIMTWPVMSAVLRLALALPAGLVDLTGGAPELNPDFRRFVAALREAELSVQVRTNLTVFDEPGQADIPEFLMRNQVRLVASLPCYLDENVAAQRGQGVYPRSIAALRRLNSLGYGCCEELPLDLVYNPGGPFLPPDQAALEADYRCAMRTRHGIEFTRLLTITNMPAGRFLRELRTQGQAIRYQSLLQDSFNPQTLDGLMCRSQICIAWDGTLADCDFNLAIGLGVAAELPNRIDKLDPAMLHGRTIVTGDHCFACTAGCGSSCKGALVA
ncbi:MAG: radical SAM/Cys-rich domain protein [Desulfuromonas sp.]|nr:radical SAM/Cys-rich domain protein [Desulfuromonas sp.]